MKSTVEVDREALRKILEVVTSDDPLALCELHDTMHDPNGPVMTVIRDFNSSIAYQKITDGLFGDADE